MSQGGLDSLREYNIENRNIESVIDHWKKEVKIIEKDIEYYTTMLEKTKELVRLLEEKFKGEI